MSPSPFAKKAKMSGYPGGDPIKAALKQLSKDGKLDADLVPPVLEHIEQGSATPAQIGAFLALLSRERCTPEIITNFAKEFRKRAADCFDGSSGVDIVGTGGDGSDTFNISTASAFIIAAAGCPVVKHGNRAASSKSGSADLLEKLGADLDVPRDQLERVYKECGFVFLFAKQFHPFMKHFGPIRAELGIPTVMNIMGPILNPAGVTHMVAGVFAPFIGPLYAETLRELGYKRALVVHGQNPALDELSICSPTLVWELKEDKSISHYEFTPENAGLKRHSLELCGSGTPEENAVRLRAMFSGKHIEEPALMDFLLLNSGAALYVAGKAATIKEGADLAREAITNGKARKTLEAYAKHCHPL